MLCTLRPVSNLLSLALCLTEHLHNLAVPKNSDTETYPSNPPPPCAPTTLPHPQVLAQSTMEAGTHSETLYLLFFMLLSLSCIFPFLFLPLYFSISVPVPLKVSNSSPTHTHARTHARTHAHAYTHIHTHTHAYTTYQSVCLVNFFSGLFLKDSIFIKATVALRQCL